MYLSPQERISALSCLSISALENSKLDKHNLLFLGARHLWESNVKGIYYPEFSQWEIIGHESKVLFKNCNCSGVENKWPALNLPLPSRMCKSSNLRERYSKLPPTDSTSAWNSGENPIFSGKFWIFTIKLSFQILVEGLVNVPTSQSNLASS